MMKAIVKPLAACLLTALILAGCAGSSSSAPSAGQSEASAPQSGDASGSESSALQENEPEGGGASTALLPDEMRAMWISYIELRDADLSTETALRSSMGAMFDDCVAMGLNTVIVAVRPFSDAMYRSDLFPFSNFLTGTQGQDPGYDPMAVMIEMAHERDLRFEAWVNPYRVRLQSQGPQTLAETNPAVLHPEWAGEVNGEVWYDPGLPAVQELLLEGVREILAYEVDGVHFDDYFYPTFPTAEEDTAFDAETYAQYGGGMDKAAWRRQNVNNLVARVYELVRELRPETAFGISPQGNNDNNYNTQYSDVRLWLAEPGYVDYVMPQLYWGFGYRSASGSDVAAFANKCAEWAGYPRSDAVALYAGLAPYRIGAGDGGANDQDEWFTGHNIADQIEYVRGVQGIQGYALFRYEFLTSAADPLYREEAQAISAANA